jgi:hypothetical protein
MAKIAVELERERVRPRATHSSLVDPRCAAHRIVKGRSRPSSASHTATTDCAPAHELALAEGLVPSAPHLCATPHGRYHRDMSVKQRLHAAVDAMTEPEATAALQSLADASGDPVMWLLDHAPSEAPLDDEVDALARFDAEYEAGSSTISAES